MINNIGEILSFGKIENYIVGMGWYQILHTLVPCGTSVGTYFDFFNSGTNLLLKLSFINIKLYQCKK